MVIGDRMAETVRKYASQLIPAVPDLVTRMDARDWGRSLRIIGDKHQKVGESKEKTEVCSFVSYLLDTFKTVDPEEIPYFLDELDKIPKEVDGSHRRGAVDLERIIVESITNRKERFSRDDLSRLHDVLLSMYSQSVVRFVSAPEYFEEFVDEIEGVPDKFRSQAIEYAKKIVTYFFEEEPALFADRRDKLKQRNRAVVAYARALRENIGHLGGEFTNWTDAALKNNRTMEELIEYLEDTHSYFDEDIESTIGGLPLSEIHGRLLAYVQALTGRSIKVDRSDSLGLRCSLDEETFLFPRTINIGENDGQNFGAYKVLASYQAGAVMFDTYSFDASNLDQDVLGDLSDDASPQAFFESFGNPIFAQGLFELLELARIDTRLRKKFPGLVRDLRTFGDYISELGTEADNDATLALNELTRHIYQGDKNGATLDDKVFDEVETLRVTDSTVTDTFNAVHRIYRNLDERIDLSQDITVESPLSLDVEDIEEGIEQRGVGYLIAEPGEESEIGKRFRYDEWDEGAQEYREGFVQVVEGPYPDVSENSLVERLLERDHATIQLLRRNFETLKPEEIEVVRRQVSGDIDYDLLVRARGEMNAGITPSEKIYTREYKDRRSVVSLVVSEGSGSLKKFIDLDNPNLRIIDIIRQTQVYFSEALDSIGDRYGLASFSGETEKNVEFYLIKGFDQPYDGEVKRTIGSMKPLSQNRDGAGIRHATHLLAAQPERTRLLVYLMEGLPHDFGYEKSYAIADTRRAIVEAKRDGCIPLVLAFGPNIHDDVRSLSNHAIYREVSDPRSVPRLLPQLYRSITL